MDKTELVVRKIIGLIGVICMGTLPVCGQSYRVYRPFAPESQEPAVVDMQPPRYEIALYGVDSIGKISDGEGESISSYLRGFRGEGGYRVSEYIWVVASWEELKAADQQTSLLSTIKRKQFTLGAKWVLTPNTNSKLYALAGVGRCFHQTKFSLRAYNFNAQSWVYVIGVGEQFHLYKGLYLAVQYRLSYDGKRWESFVFKSKALRHEVGVGLTYNF